MAKFTVEVELDWLGEESTVDEAIHEQVVRGLQDRLLQKLEKRFESKIEDQINEKVESIAEQFITKLIQEQIGDIQIPVKSSSWGSSVEYVTLTEFMGKEFEKAITEKTLSEHGGKADYRNDAKHSIVTYLTKDYIAKELNEKVAGMIREAKDKAEKSLVSSLEANLQQQLHADMLKRLNIPELLINLQNTVEQTEGN